MSVIQSLDFILIELLLLSIAQSVFLTRLHNVESCYPNSFSAKYESNPYFMFPKKSTRIHVCEPYSM